jgi:hypothetical protein
MYGQRMGVNCKGEVVDFQAELVREEPEELDDLAYQARRLRVRWTDLQSAVESVRVESSPRDW